MEDGAAAAKYGEPGVEKNTLLFYPFAYAVLDELLSDYCWSCLKAEGEAESGLKRCSRCKVAHFCDRRCQKAGWPDHKLECAGFVSSLDGEQGTLFVPDVEIRLLGRIVSRHDAVERGQGQPLRSRRRVMELWSHSEEMRADERAGGRQFERVYADLLAFYGPKKLSADKETVFQLHCRNWINRHAISDASYLREIAKGLYLDLCAYNHSCRPNAIYTCDGLTATLRPLDTAVDIADRNNTFYTYIDLLNSKQQRRQMLKESWYFDCQCTRCLDPYEHILTSCLCPNCDGAVYIFGHCADKNMDTLEIKCTHCGAECPKERVCTAIESMRTIDRLLNEGLLEKQTREHGSESALAQVKVWLDEFGRCLPNVNVYYTRLLQQAIHYSPRESVSHILQFHLDAVPCLKVCYPENHPTLLLHHMNIGLLYRQLKDPTTAERYLSQAHKGFSLVLGENHPLTKQAAEHLLTSTGRETAVDYNTPVDSN